MVYLNLLTIDLPFLQQLFVTVPLCSSTMTPWCQPVLKALEMTKCLLLPWLRNIETTCAVLRLTSLVWRASLCWLCGGVLVDYGVRSRAAEVWFPGLCPGRQPLAEGKGRCWFTATWRVLSIGWKMICFWEDLLKSQSPEQLTIPPM